MKHLFLSLLILSLYNCREAKNQSDNIDKEIASPQFSPDWLLGNWERIGEKGDKKTYEQWQKNATGAFIGMGCTLKGLDTVWKENILLSKSNGSWTFDVTGLGDSIATSFAIIQMDKDKFICVNDLNEFPKKIEYAFADDMIHAKISGGGPTIPFDFKRIKPGTK